METLNLWYQRCLSGKKVALLAIALCCSYPLLAQRKPTGGTKATVINLQNYDNRRLHFGMTIGAYVGRYNLQYNRSALTNNANGADPVQITDIESRNSPGLLVGAVINYRLGSYHWDLRSTPGVGFLYEPSVYYQFEGDAEYVRLGDQVATLEVPLYLTYKSERRKNHRMYFFAGPNLSTRMSSKALEPVGSPLGRNTELAINQTNIEISYGFGFHFYLAFFNFAPEVRFYHGLLNLHDRQPNDALINNVLDRVSSTRIAILLNFEG